MGAAIDSPITELHYSTKNFWTLSFLKKRSRRGSVRKRTRPSRKSRSRMDRKKKQKGKKDSEDGYASVKTLLYLTIYAFSNIVQLSSPQMWILPLVT